jgi:hypothetical protein
MTLALNRVVVGIYEHVIINLMKSLLLSHHASNENPLPLTSRRQAIPALWSWLQHNQMMCETMRFTSLAVSAPL